MGQLASRQQGSRNDEDRSPAHFYRFPAKSGAYFGSHFLMGGERFESSSPEAYLFGENPDLNFLGAKPVPFPYPQPQSTEPTRTLQCLVNIRRDSLKFVKVRSEDSSVRRNVSGSCLSESGCSSVSGDAVRAPVDTCEVEVEHLVLETEKEGEDEGGGCVPQPSSQDPPQVQEGSPTYNIEFTFDSDYPCSITIHLFAKEESCSSLGMRYKSKKLCLEATTYHFQAGANQTFSEPELIFDPCAFTPEELQYQADSDIFPVVIHCVAQEIDERGSVVGDAQSHSTLAVVEKSAEGHGFILKPLKQKLFIDGVCYLLQEIYGIENKNVNASLHHSDSKASVPHEDFDENGADCVVCMSELRDTLILPCRHLCLCSACAETLRYKASNCPICRSPFRALLQIKTLRRLKSSTSAPLLSSTALTGTGRVESADPAETSPTLQGTFLTTRYETVPLIEALNGPVDHTQTCVTLPAPSLPVSHSAPAISVLGTAPRPPPRIGGGRHKKKHVKPVVPIQEVLTPQAIVGCVPTNAEKGSSGVRGGPESLDIPTLAEEEEEEETEFGAGSPSTSRVTRIRVDDQQSGWSPVSDSEEASVLPEKSSLPGLQFLHSSSSGAIDGQDETPRSSVSAASLSSTKPLLPSGDSGSLPDVAEC